MGKGYPASYAKVMDEGTAIIPKRGETVCSPACLGYVLCASYDEGEVCSGYKPLENGKATMRMLENLAEADKIYIGNASKFVQRSLDMGEVEDAETVISDVKRFLKDPEDWKSTKKEIVNISLFGNFEIPNQNIKKPQPQPEEPKPPQERPQELKIREMLEKNVFRSLPNPNYVEQHIKQEYPETCSNTCPYITCPYRKNENFGKKCQQRIQWEQNEPNEKSPLTISRTPKQPISLLKRGWNEL